MKKKYVITIIKIKSIIIIIYEIIIFILYNKYTIELGDVRFFFLLMSWLIINYLLLNLKDNYGGFINYFLFNLKDYHVK